MTVTKLTRRMRDHARPYLRDHEQTLCEAIDLAIKAGDVLAGVQHLQREVQFGDGVSFHAQIGFHDAKALVARGVFAEHVRRAGVCQKTQPFGPATVEHILAALEQLEDSL